MKQVTNIENTHVIRTTNYQVTSASNTQEHCKIIHCGTTYTLSFASRSSITMHANLPLFIHTLRQIKPLHITAEHPNNLSQYLTNLMHKIFVSQ